MPPEIIELQNQIRTLAAELADLRSIIFRKTGSSPSDINVTNKLATPTIDSKQRVGATGTGLMGFYGATAVDQPAAISDSTTQSLTGANTIDQTKLESDLNNHKTAINALIARLEELGLIST